VETFITDYNPPSIVSLTTPTYNTPGPQKLVPRRQWLLAELADITPFSLQTVPPHEQMAITTTGPDQIIRQIPCNLPTHLLVSPDAHAKTPCPQTKAEITSSDDTLVEVGRRRCPTKQGQKEDATVGFALDQMVHDAQKRRLMMTTMAQ